MQSLYAAEAFIEECMREGKTGTLTELIAQRGREMRDKGYVKNAEGFWVEQNDHE